MKPMKDKRQEQLLNQQPRRLPQGPQSPLISLQQHQQQRLQQRQQAHLQQQQQQQHQLQPPQHLRQLVLFLPQRVLQLKSLQNALAFAQELVFQLAKSCCVANLHLLSRIQPADRKLFAVMTEWLKNCGRKNMVEVMLSLVL